MNPIRHRARRLAVSAVYDRAFKMLIDTSLAGSASDTFVLPIYTGINYAARISWGDGSTTNATTGSQTHQYPASGRYIITIRALKRGGFPPIYFNNTGDKLKVISILQWGAEFYASMWAAYYGCANLTIQATDGAIAGSGNVTSMEAAFSGCTSLKETASFPHSAVLNYSNVYNGCVSLIKVNPVDLSNVTTMAAAYYGCAALKTIPWLPTGKVTSLYAAFYQCGLTSFPHIDTSAVLNFENAWAYNTGLDGFDFPTLDMHAITNGTYVLRNVNFSKAAYNSMLDQLAFGRGSIPAAAVTGINFRTNAHYDSSTGGYDGTAARAYLTGTKTWNIVDGGTP